MPRHRRGDRGRGDGSTADGPGSPLLFSSPDRAAIGSSPSSHSLPSHLALGPRMDPNRPTPPSPMSPRHAGGLHRGSAAPFLSDPPSTPPRFAGALPTTAANPQRNSSAAGYVPPSPSTPPQQQKHHSRESADAPGVQAGARVAVQRGRKVRGAAAARVVHTGAVPDPAAVLTGDLDTGHEEEEEQPWYKSLPVLTKVLFAAVLLLLLAVVLAVAIGPPRHFDNGSGGPPHPSTPKVTHCNGRGELDPRTERCRCDEGWGTADCGARACASPSLGGCPVGTRCNQAVGVCRAVCGPGVPPCGADRGGSSLWFPQGEGVLPGEAGPRDSSSSSSGSISPGGGGDDGGGDDADGGVILAPDGKFVCLGAGRDVCACAPGWAGSQCNVCDRNFFGSDCGKYCSSGVTCAGNGVCDTNGECICTAGYYPADSCERFCDPVKTCAGLGTCGPDGSCLCTAGKYGANCTIDCDPAKDCSGRGSCGHDGTCVCDDGWAPPDCSTCAPFHVGDNCDECERNVTCSGHGTCTPENGCQCDPHFAPPNCVDCTDGWYGPSCGVFCTGALNCSGNGECQPSGGNGPSPPPPPPPDDDNDRDDDDHDDDGVNANRVDKVRRASPSVVVGPAEALGNLVVRGMRALSSGGVPLTDVVQCYCDQGWYGPDCSAYCVAGYTCNGHGSCNEVTGACECSDGNWSGKHCDECDDPWFGRHCDTYCDPVANCTGHGTCDTDGACACDPALHWHGDHCDECSPPWYGPKCDTFCDAATNCTAPRGTCDDSTGQCICDYHFAPPDCSECAGGWHGPNCDLPCDPVKDCSGHGKCEHSTAMCQCDIGWHGPHCDTYCLTSTNCTSPKVCSDDGSACVCPGHTAGPNCEACADNWYGYPSCDVICGRDITCGGHGSCVVPEDPLQPPSQKSFIALTTLDIPRAGGSAVERSTPSPDSPPPDAADGAQDGNPAVVWCECDPGFHGPNCTDVYRSVQVNGAVIDADALTPAANTSVIALRGGRFVGEVDADPAAGTFTFDGYLYPGAYMFVPKGGKGREGFPLTVPLAVSLQGEADSGERAVISRQLSATELRIAVLVPAAVRTAAAPGLVVQVNITAYSPDIANHTCELIGEISDPTAPGPGPSPSPVPPPSPVPSPSPSQSPLPSASALDPSPDTTDNGSESDADDKLGDEKTHGATTSDDADENPGLDRTQVCSLDTTTITMASGSAGAVATVSGNTIAGTLLVTVSIVDGTVPEGGPQGVAGTYTHVSVLKLSRVTDHVLVPPERTGQSWSAARIDLVTYRVWLDEDSGPEIPPEE